MAQSFSTCEINTFLNELTQHENPSLLHLNIKNLRSNLDCFRTLLEGIKRNFNVICLTETWLKDNDFKANSNYHFPNKKSIHYEKKLTKEGLGLTDIWNDLTHKIQNQLCIPFLLFFIQFLFILFLCISDGDRSFHNWILTKNMKYISFLLLETTRWKLKKPLWSSAGNSNQCHNGKLYL